MRTTIDLPDPLFRKMKAAAALRGTTLKGFVEGAVERELEARPRKQHRVRLPLIHAKEKRTLQLNNRQIDEILFG